MNRKVLSIIVLVAVIFSVNGFCGKNPNTLKFDEAEFRIVKPQIIKLDNGMDLYFVENHELPIVNVRIIMKGGSLYDPDDKYGISSMALRLMTSSGTESMTASEVEDELDYIVSSIGSWSGLDSLSVYMNCLSEHFDRTFEMMMEMIYSPAFQQDRFELNKKQRIESIRRKWDYPGSIAWRTFYKVIYGEDSVWGRESSVEDIENISREDLIDYHKKYINPKGAIIGIVGDFNIDEVVKKFNEAFKSWKAVDIEFPELEKVNDNVKPGVYFIEKDIEQTNMYIGHLGVNEKNEDRFSIDMFNKIFGSGFASRLFREVREKRGLAYSVYGYLGKGKDRGVFRISCKTKPERTIEAVEVIIEQINRMKNELVSDEEFEIARDDSINSYAFAFESASQSLGKFMWLDFDEILPKDYYDTYIDNVKKIKKKDIKKVAQKYLNTDDLVIVVVGNRDKFEKELETLGEVTVIELEDDPGLEKE